MSRPIWACGILLCAGMLPVAQAGFSRTAQDITIAFDNGVSLTLAAPGGHLQGMSEVTVNGRALRSGAFKAHPVFALADGESHDACQVESVAPSGDGVVVTCRLTPKRGAGSDTLKWVFEPRLETIRDREYVGLAYRYEFSSDQRKLDEILDLSTWEVDGDISGAFVQPGKRANAPDAFRTWEGWTFLSTPWFRFQCGAEGMLYDVYEEVCPAKSHVEKRAGSPLLHTFDTILQPGTGSGRTPFRQIMFCDHRGARGLQRVDEYTKVLDHLEAIARAEFGIRDPSYMPVCKAPQRRDETFELRLQELQEIADLGFKGIWMCTLEAVASKVNKQKMVNAGIYSLDPARILGGTMGLKRLVQAARRLGLEIYTWAPGGQLKPESHVLKAHPDWLLHVPEGTRRPLGGSTDLHSGYYDYAIRKYRELHDSTGLTGAWLDSFNWAGKAVQVRPDGTRYFQVRKAFRMVADMQRRGLENIQLEGAGPAGQDATTTSYFRPGTPLDYKSALYVGAARNRPINYYYRYIANKSFPMMPVRYVLWTYEYKSLDQFPELRRQVRRANLDWSAVQDLMHQRRIIASADDPWEDVGAEWTTPDSNQKALFSYGVFDYELPAGASVTDVTTGRQMACDGVLKTECCHTYRVAVAP